MSLARKPGKRVGGWLYLHRSAIRLLTADESGKISAAEELANMEDWNVVKIRGQLIGLLHYQSFDEHPFPALLRSAAVDLGAATCKFIDYSHRANPPILHRKELLLPEGDPRIPGFAALTHSAEEYGLFSEPTKIGTRKAWADKIDTAGLVLDGHALRRQGDRNPTVHRFKTAIQRSGLSQPVNLMLRYGMIDRSVSVFDYGCGRGGDVEILKDNGYEAFGWDPVHAPDGPRRKADLVNLGFVLNVIENPHERKETLRVAWSFATRGIVVSVMPHGKTDTSRLVSYADGYLSGRNTFQKYFVQDELRELLNEISEEPPVNFAPGIVAAFRDKDLEQRVLFRRKSRAVSLGMNINIPQRVRFSPPTMRRPSIRDVLTEELEEIWRFIVELGRPAAPEELSDDLKEAIASKGVRIETAIAESLAAFGNEATLEAAAAARREDLLVHFAVGLFPGAVKYGELPLSIRRDVRIFFGSHSSVLAAAREVLTSIRSASSLIDAAEEAARAGFGTTTQEGQYWVAMSLEGALPVPLRVMLGCCGILDRSFETYDFARLNPAVRTVEGFKCVNPEGPIPRVTEQAFIDLGRARVSKRSVDDKGLFLKSRYLNQSDDGISNQLRIDHLLLRSGLVDGNGRGPSHSEISKRLMEQSRTQ